MNKILVVNMNYLGDALMTTPAHAAIRRAFPNAVIDTIAGAQAGYGAFDILSNNPDIDHLIPRAAGGFAKRCFQLWVTLVRGRYDAAVILPAISAYSMTAALAFTAKRYAVRRTEQNEHMTDVMLSGIADLVKGVETPRRLVLNVSDNDRLRARMHLGPLSGRGPLIGINLGASRPQKRWPVGGFVTVVESLIGIGGAVALLGGPNGPDREAAAAIVQQVGGSGIVDLTGQTTVRDLGAVIESCDVLVTADTGAMHIASALSVPTVALFGSTNPEVVGPYGDVPCRILYKKLPCSPCNNHPTCGGLFTCMTDIQPSEVFVAVQDLLGRLEKK